ncbi:MAG TPA: xanthine dehydrogenase family protein molybdopterin-binding subunit [Acidimicrobiales bacterium]|nr:xanthine dehydrogenase family protein molybdopterin-binding subunit [Acidimicrobiales bacterium]
MSLLGERVKRTEDRKFLTTGGTYVDDLPHEGALWVTYLRSTVAHARISSIDVSDARNALGVVDVITGDDIDLAPLPPDFGLYNDKMVRPWLPPTGGKVRYVGEPVVAILSETRAQAVDASELIVVDYDPLPAVVGVENAAKDESLLFEEAGTNLAFEMKGDSPPGDPTLFEGCDVVVRQRTVNQRVAPAPLETRACAVRWEGDHLTVWASTQAPHGVRDAYAKHFELEPEQIRVISPDVGGGFGAKISPYVEELLLPWLARRSGKPVRWAETRTESMLNLGHGRGQVQEVELGGTRDGKLLAYRLTVDQDCGAYCKVGGLMVFSTRMMATGVYDIPKAHYACRSWVTNTTPTVAYRGAGRPEAAAAIERAVDLFAAEAGLDPAEVRRLNFIAAFGEPHTTTMGTVYDTGDYPAALSLALDKADYAGLRAEQKRRRETNDSVALGIGLSVYVEVTGGAGAGEWAGVSVDDSGKVTVRTGTSPHGQGHNTAWAQIASSKLGVAMSDITVEHGDTDIIPMGGGTMGSRSLQHGGAAVAKVCDMLLEKAAGGPLQGLSADASVSASGPTFPFGAHVAIVEVDTETGMVKLRQLVAVDDAGKILNPTLADGQVHGGVAQGVAQALLEEFSYDADGNPLTSTLADYAFVTAAELPSVDRFMMETPTPNNELGAKGIGESGTIGSTPAVQNAVVDALAHLGVRHIDMPTTPEKVWREIQKARS